MRIAIPTDNPGGLKANRAEHFGHCDIFTLVDLDEGKGIRSVETIANGGHEAGGCMVPVNVLHQAGADAIIVSGMGARPMQGFTGVGIKVYFAMGEGGATAHDTINKFIANQLPLMHGDQVCQGSGNCSH